jgi:hypothetical protein
MMKLWTSISLVFMLIQQTGNTHQPPDLIVRLVYLDNGKPADNQQIILYEGNPSQASTIRSTKITDQDGIAKFHVSEPLPEKVWVNDDNGHIRSCAWEDQIPLQEILANGVTIGKDARFGAACKGSQDTITRLGAKPGEIVIFVRKLSNWDNLGHY